ncbi:MAG: hypothetical protein AB7K09_05730, partial [Planctomycetota bacterium]
MSHDLATLLAAPPSVPAFLAIIQHVATLAPGAQPAAIAAAQQGLQGWPDETREAPAWWFNRFTDAQASLLPLVRSFVMPSVPFSVSRLIDVLSRPEAASLTRLDVKAAGMSKTQWMNVLSRVSSTTLHALHVADLTDPMALALSTWPGASRLRELHIDGMSLQAAGAAALATSGLMANLEVLDAPNGGIGDQGVAALYSPASKVTRLRVLKCGRGCTDATLITIARSERSRHLRELELRYLDGLTVAAPESSHLTDAGMMFVPSTAPLRIMLGRTVTLEL